MRPCCILVVDDDAALTVLLSQFLRASGYAVEVALDGETALALFSQVAPDLIVLDLMMPGIDGFAVLEQVRQTAMVPVLVLSAKHAIGHKVRALNMGADDYVTKPFDMGELVARIGALLRRAQYQLSDEYGHVRQFGSLCIDQRKRCVTLREERLHLTPTEYALLLELSAHPDEVLSHSALLERIWGPECREEIQYLHVYVQRLRSKIEDDPANPCYIVKEAGVGYRFCSPPSQS
jgi:DNA-binding response OmpR family regulator